MRGMRRRPSPIQSVGATLLVVLLGAGCADDAEPTDDPTTSDSPSSEAPTEEPTQEPTEGSAEGPVAGAGAEIAPEDVEAWCGAVTPEQLAAATGYEVEAVETYGSGIQTCNADLPGSEVTLTWGAEATKQSYERYAAGFDKPAGVYEPTEVALGSGTPSVVAIQPGVRAAFAGTVVDGRLTQVRVTALVAQDADPEELGEIARQVLAVYVA